MAKIDINALQIHYDEYLPSDHSEIKHLVLLLHGWGANGSLFSHFATAISNNTNTRVLALDWPGFGQSETPNKSWETKDFSDFLDAFIAKLELKDIDMIVGHSHGGRVALYSAAQNKHLCKKLLLVGSAGIKVPLTLQKKIRVMSFKFAKNIILYLPLLSREKRERLLDSLRGYFGSADYKNAGLMRETLVKVLNQDLTDLLPQISLPTLLIWGEDDDQTPLSLGKKMEQLIPNAGLVIWENASHYAFLDRPGDFIAVSSHFLTQE